ncbi:GNAT family N-acetyltransferase [Pararhizobium sp.]|uniref:GNAT family N-acetyltransferase n=1 Tax=Pararhizobium sp. TaxID=1977563 RepID=UPI0027188BC6|nr:GNAT family N-acetyltransferase [Pararhizobium sp.]MDO9417913.1 GNAT family N-acetyltransferase [Pararhizobium sp.]
MKVFASDATGLKGLKRMHDLPSVRRLEAVGFRAWPAASVQYDGSWLIRLTAGHPSKRLNSVNPLDPSDYRDIEIRLEKAAKRFADYDLPLTIRQTPLTPGQLIAHMDENGWQAFDESLVMMADIPVAEVSDAIDHLPIRDVGRFVDARILIGGEDQQNKPGLTEVINAIKPEHGLFLFEEPDLGPAAIALVVHDNDLAGIMQLGVAEQLRRKGFGTAVLNAGLKWARLRGARKAWLQVEADNVEAVNLYRRAGFKDVYRYVYRRPGAAA